MRIKTLSFVFAGACVGAVALPQSASAAPTTHNELPRKGGKTGLGVSVGDPMGLSLKHFFSSHHALQFHLAWLPLHNLGGGIGVDYLFAPGVFYRGKTLDVIPYFGLGVALGFDLGRNTNGKKGRAGLIIKPPVGVTLHFLKVPIDTALEGTWSPYVVYGPARPPYLLSAGDVSVKVRYYF